MQTHSEENYLKKIYQLGQNSMDKVSATALSHALGINPASVIDMLKKLANKKLIEYDKVNGTKLTNTGLAISLLTLRRHRLWEMFLQEKLGYSWDEVHDIAEQLEHVKDESLADRLDKFLGFPQFDPHGESIPDSKGQVPDINRKILKGVEVGKMCRVISVRDTSKAFLQYLRKLNIAIGVHIQVIEKIDFDGSFVIMIGNSEKITVSEKFTESILVD
jgi:DtxR family Mn-dependent transcriptional regulator